MIPAGGSDFAHTHAEQVGGDGKPMFALPGTSFGPELEPHHHFDEPGLYRLWAQFRTADGDVVAVSFPVQAR